MSTVDDFLRGFRELYARHARWRMVIKRPHREGSHNSRQADSTRFGRLTTRKGMTWSDLANPVMMRCESDPAPWQAVVFRAQFPTQSVEVTDDRGMTHILSHPKEYSADWTEFRRLARLAASVLTPEEYAQAGILSPDIGDVEQWLAWVFRQSEGTRLASKLDEFTIIDDIAKASMLAVERIIELRESRTIQQSPLPVNTLAHGKAANPPATGNAQPEASITPAKKKPGKLSELNPHDLEAWQASLVHGVKQQVIADRLNRKYKTTYTQGQVSKMIKRAKKQADASGLTDRLLPMTRIQSVDPSRLELGARTTRSKARPSDVNTED